MDCRVSVIKLIVVLVKPQAWIRGVGRRIYAVPAVSLPILVILTVISFYYLLQELSMVQVFAAFLVFWLVMLIALLPFGRAFLPAIESAYSNNRAVWKKSWLTMVIWVILLVWALKELI
jgi:O-antigen ligase